jgi:hypothetical protein
MAGFVAVCLALELAAHFDVTSPSKLHERSHDQPSATMLCSRALSEYITILEAALLRY